MSDQIVTVYSKTACVQCKATKKKLAALGVPWVEVDVEDHPEAAQSLSEAGWRSLPVVKAGGDWWAGYQPDRLAALV